MLGSSQTLGGRYKFSKIRIFSSELEFYHRQQIHLFSLKWQAHFIHFPQNVCLPKKSVCLSLVFQVCHLHNHTNAFSQNNHDILICSEGALWVLPSSSHTIFLKCTQGLQFNKIDNFCHSIKDFLKKFYLFLAALGLHCCTRTFSSCSEQGLLFVPMRGLLIVVASLVAEPGL